MGWFKRRCNHPMAETTRWIVTLEPGGSLAAIRSRLEGAGLNIEQVLEEIGLTAQEVSRQVVEAVARTEAQLEGVDVEG